jgi:hypothetical protein
VIRNHDKKGNPKAPDYDLLLFAEDDEQAPHANSFFDTAQEESTAGNADEVPF